MIMKTWKEAPHLFANGNFRVAVEEYQPNPSKHKIYIFARWDGIVGGIDGQIIGEHGYDRKSLPFERCTLIARPISDMTDEEVRELKGIPSMSSEHCRSYKEILVAKANSGKLEYFEWMGLMRYGIYWGKQSDFGDTVINANSLEEA